MPARQRVGDRQRGQQPDRHHRRREDQPAPSAAICEKSSRSVDHIGGLHRLTDDHRRAVDELSRIGYSIAPDHAHTDREPGEFTVRCQIGSRSALEELYLSYNRTLTPPDQVGREAYPKHSRAFRVFIGFLPSQCRDSPCHAWFFDFNRPGPLLGVTHWAMRRATKETSRSDYALMRRAIT